MASVIVASGPWPVIKNLAPKLAIRKTLPVGL